MVDAVNVPTNGFVAPPPAGGAATPPVDGQGFPPVPPAGRQAPGFVPPAGSGGFTQADIDAAIEADRKTRMDTPAAPPVPATPPQAIETGVEDEVLEAYSESLMAIAPELDLNRAIGKALDKGDLSLIDEHYINEKGGASAARALVLAKALVSRVQEQTTAATTATHALAGGVDQWNAVSAAFNQNAPEHLKLVVIKMLNSGNAGSIKAGAQMAIDFATQNGFTAHRGTTVQADAAGVTSGQALDKQAFKDGLAALRAKYPQGGPQKDQAENALFAARMAGKQRGL